MAKRTKKISQAQRDKYFISVAKRLKEVGIISKQANLHSGKYISKKVLAKAKAFEASAKLNYGTTKVSKDIAAAAKARGYQVVQGNKIVGPKSQLFRNRLKRGELTGVRPVKGGMMEEVVLPHTVFDMRSLVNQLQEGIDSLKMDNEYFAFTYQGGVSRKAFRDTQELLEWLTHYKSFMEFSNSKRPEDLQDEFENLTIFRLAAADIRQNIPTERERKERAKWKRLEDMRNGKGVVRRKRKKTRAEWIAGLPNWRQEKIKAADKARQDAYYNKVKNDPEYKAKKVERVRKWRAKQSHKK